MNYDKIFTPIQIGNYTLPNRIIMGSMHLGLEGLPKTAERMATFYGKRLDGGCALITTGGISVNHAGIGNPVFFNFQKDEDCRELERFLSIVKGKGVMCAQLFHAGRYAYHRGLVGPSPIRAPISRFVPKELTEAEAWETIEDFGKSAAIAKQIGFGAVEIMGSEGYLVNQFCSPVTNKRTDFFGGTPEKRMNFGIEVVKSVKKHLQDEFPVIIRTSGIDLIPGNPSQEEVIEYCKKLKENGVHALNIGIGWHESRVPTISMLVPRGAWAKIAKIIKDAVPGIPIIASNRVNSPETIVRVLNEGEADIVSMARPFLADAEIVNKIRNKKTEHINTCIACNQACLDHAFREMMVSCLVNPEANREIEFAEMPKGQKSKVVVVGSGPGGMEAARVAAVLGHKVILIEAGKKLGGQLQMAATVPGKFEFYETIRYYSHELKALNVDIRVNTFCTTEMLEQINPDAVIFATGVRPRDVKIPGLEKKNHASYVDFLTGKFTPGKNVVIIGGGGIACDSAHKILEGHDPSIEDYFTKYNVKSYTNTVIQEHKPNTKISIFRRSGKIGSGLGATTGWALLQELKSNGVDFYTSLNYKEVTDVGLVIETKAGEVQTIECDSILLCAGQEKEDSLAQEYSKKHSDKQVFIVGGAKDASGVDAKRAILEGSLAARAVGVM
jgi:2,4-dienoyl-CoA reductase (NADPH2)